MLVVTKVAPGWMVPPEFSVTSPVIEPLPPVEIEPGSSIGGRVAYHEYGIVTVQLEIPFEGTWEEIAALARHVPL